MPEKRAGARKEPEETKVNTENIAAPYNRGEKTVEQDGSK